MITLNVGCVGDDRVADNCSKVRCVCSMHLNYITKFVRTFRERYYNVCVCVLLCCNWSTTNNLCSHYRELNVYSMTSYTYYCDCE